MEFSLTLRNYTERILKDLRTAEAQLAATIAEMKKIDIPKVQDLIPNIELNFGGVKEAVSALEAAKNDYSSISRKTAMHFLAYLTHDLRIRMFEVKQRLYTLSQIENQALAKACQGADAAIDRIIGLETEIDDITRDLRKK